MSTQLSPDLGGPDAPAPPTDRGDSTKDARRGRGMLWFVLGAVAALAVVIAVVIVRDDGSTTTTTTPSTVTTAPPSTTSVTSTPTSTVPADLSTAVFPTAQSGVTFTDPVAAARAFATFLGFTDPVVGNFLAGDNRSGEIEVRPNATGPVTTVLVRQLDSVGHWYVLGSVTDNIQVTAPDALTTVTSPVPLAGTSTAFEANVSVQLYADGVAAPLADTFVMGGSMGQMAPFTGTLEFPATTASDGSLVFFTRSMQDGGTYEASVMRVHFGN
jgi:hypothetical protein